MEREELTALVAKAQNGDSEAFDGLFGEFYNSTYYFALKTVKDEITAQDITQEAFLECFKNIKDLKEPAAFATWMKQITYHQCTRYFKKKKDVLVEEDEDGNSLFDFIEDDSDDSIPSDVLDKKEFQDTIRFMIDKLSEEQRAAVMMFYYDELSVKQIAEIQGVSEGTVKSRLNYARKAIRKSVEDYEKQYDVNLHSVALAPLLLLLFNGKEMLSFEAAEAMRVSLIKSVSSAVEGAASSAISGKVASVKGTNFLSKISSASLKTKIISAVSAAVIVGSTSGIIATVKKNEGPTVEYTTEVSETILTDAVALDRETDCTEHSFGEWDVIKLSTCDEEGECIRICSNCGFEEKKAVPVTEHEFDDWTISKMPTCYEEGTVSRHCSICGLTEENTIEMTDHNWSITNVVPPEIGVAGYFEYKCSFCGKTVNTRDDDIPGICDHLNASDVPELDSRTVCHWKCPDCNAEWTTIDKCNHQYYQVESDREGMIAYYCDLCTKLYYEPGVAN